jgi:signal transduction histidine kinase
MLRAFIDPPATGATGGWSIIVAIIVVIGFLDYISGTDASLAILYLVPVMLVTGWKGAGAGVAVAVVCTITRIVSDAFVTFPDAPALSLFWNALASFVIALIVVWLFHALLTLHRDLEGKILERTAQLEQSMTERARLERELLEASSRERSNFGRELHDEIGQHLVATALAVQALAQRLTGPLATDALAIVDWTEEAVAKTRNLARGLLLAEISPHRLIGELEELSVIARHARTAFALQHDGAPIHASRVECAQLYRIAQEAVTNAIRHASATRITLSVTQQHGAVTLTVEDDGRGISREQPNRGMGMQIMSQRARLIGAKLTIEPGPTKGTRVTCTLAPLPPATHG